jgi:hypothetical protein
MVISAGGAWRCRYFSWCQRRRQPLPRSRTQVSRSTVLEPVAAGWRTGPRNLRHAHATGGAVEAPGQQETGTKAGAIAARMIHSGGETDRGHLRRGLRRKTREIGHAGRMA